MPKHFRILVLEIWFGKEHSKLIELASEIVPLGKDFFDLAFFKERTNNSSGRSAFHGREHDSYRLSLDLYKTRYKMVLRIR